MWSSVRLQLCQIYGPCGYGAVHGSSSCWKYWGWALLFAGSGQAFLNMSDVGSAVDAAARWVQ